MLNVADNSGAKQVLCIGIPGGTGKRYATVGDKIKVSVKEAAPKSNVKKKEVLDAVVLRTKKPIRRPYGTSISFSDNAVAIIDKNGEPRATRILGPIAREVRDKGYSKVASLSKEIY